VEQEQEKMQRWAAKRCGALVIEILRGDTSVQEDEGEAFLNGVAEHWARL
jgi:hypothetical protein